MRGPPGLLRNNSNCKPTIMCPFNAGPCSPHFNSSSPPHLNNFMKQGLFTGSLIVPFHRQGN